MEVMYTCIIDTMPRRTTTDNTRYRKTYSFFRQTPQVDVPRTIIEVSETIVRIGSMMYADAFSARPVTGATGDVFYATDVREAFFYSGSMEWRPFFDAGRLGTAPGALPVSNSSSSSTGLSSSFQNDRGAWELRVPVLSQSIAAAGVSAWVWSWPDQLTSSYQATVALQLATVPTIVDSTVSVFVGAFTGSGDFVFSGVALDTTGTHNALAGVAKGNSSSIDFAPSYEGGNGVIWARMQFTSSGGNQFFTASTGQNNGTTWIPVSSASYTMGVSVFYPCVGMLIGRRFAGKEVVARILSFSTSST